MNGKEIDLTKYYTQKQLMEISGRNNYFNSIYKNNCYHFKYKNIVLYDKDQVDEITLIRSQIQPISVVSDIVLKEYGIGIRRLKTLMIENGIPVLDKNSYPKVYDVHMYIKDTERTLELCKNATVDISPYEYYVKETSKEIKNEHLLNTLNTLNKYATGRINQNKKTSKWLVELYIIINNNLNRDLDLASEEEVQWIFDTIKKLGLNKNIGLEFAKFINYLYGIKNIVNKKTYAIDYNSNVKDNENKEPYTQDEFLKLWYFIFTSIENKELIDKALNERNCAMVWLYIALHYVTIWRREDIHNIEFPDLELIGFTDGKDFLEWLKCGNVFTKEMGRIICDNLNTKIKSLGSRASKNNSILVFEIGNLMVRPIGMLLSICEAHRRIAMEENKSRQSSKFNSHKFLITKRMSKNGYEQLLGDGLNNALNGKKFSNRRANKSYMNYIQNKSEQDKKGIGYYISSIMRGHKLDEEMFSKVTQIYIDRNVDNTILDISLTLMDRGTMGFAKYKLLTMVNGNFEYISDKEKTELIKDLKIRNSEIEKISETLVKRKQYINDFITRFVKSPKQAYLILNQLAYGDTYANHDGTKCLLRATINSCEKKEDLFSLGEKEFFNEATKCIKGNPISCIGCPMLIQEYLFLYELNNRLLDILKRFESSKTDNDKKMYTNIIFKGYLPLLQEIQKELGNDEFNIYFDMTKIKGKVENLNKNKMLKLT